jgi:hypothetical protein
MTIRSSGRKSRSSAAKAAPSYNTEWPAWQEYLRNRTGPRSSNALIAKAKPLAWGLASLADSEIPAFLALIKQVEKLGHWETTLTKVEFSGLAQAEPRWQLGIDAIACAHFLPALAGEMEQAAWQQLLDELCKLASDAAQLNPADDPLVHQLLAVELPLTLAWLLPEIPPCAALASQARKLWSWGAEEATDGEGLLAGRRLAQSLPLLACWTRLQTIIAQDGKAAVEEDVQAQFEWLLQQTLRLLREDGSTAFGVPGPQDHSELFQAALAFTDDPDDQTLAKLAFGRAKEKPPAKKPAKDNKKAASQPEPFIHSEWSMAALLRGSWASAAPRVAVAYGEQKVYCELLAGEQLLLRGDWQAEVSIDGWNWKPESDWEEVCWHTDEDVVYLELETKLTDGWKLQRQMMLATQEKFVFLSDAVLGEQPAQLGYRGVLPLQAGVKFLPAAETREGFLANKRAQAMVLPLALPEWRSETGRGELKAVPDGLELTQTQTGRRLYAPLWIDLRSDRLRKECTWRQLTVAEQLAIQPRDVAVAYRVQSGSDQFAIYRSLAKKANRTFLGQNLVHEFFAARFKSDGTTQTLLEIE